MCFSKNIQCDNEPVNCYYIELIVGSDEYEKSDDVTSVRDYIRYNGKSNDPIQFPLENNYSILEFLPTLLPT